LLPWHRQKRAYLANRPCPDHLHKAKDRRDALLQKLQKLIECMLHAAAPDGANSVKALNSTENNSINA
jgi:hypothetical protein